MRPVTAPTALRRSQATRPEGDEWRERSGRLYTEFARQALGMVRRAFRGAFSNQELEDIYSGAWLGTLRALEGRHASMSDEEIRKYLLTAVANQAAKELRRRKRKPTAPLDLVEGVRDHGGSPEDKAADAETSTITRDLLSSLPPRRRAVILLRYGWGLEPSQVCELVDGLSPRAYRKEITRGVDELTERMRRFEEGAWCADREPILKALVAGTAAEDEERQARAHLAHCRACGEFVASLRSSLHDLGGALMLPGAAAGLADELSLGGTSLVDRAREAVAAVAGRGEAEVAHEAVTRTIASGGTRGAGAAGAGVLAKLAGLGTAGKIAVACVTGGAAATACIAAGVGPLDLSGRQTDPTQRAERAQRNPDHGPAVATTGDTLPSQVGNEYAPAPAPAPPTSPDETAAGQEPSSTEAAPPPVQEVVRPTAPAVEQEFGVPAAAAPASAPVASDSSSDDSGGSVVDQEFGP